MQSFFPWSGSMLALLLLATIFARGEEAIEPDRLQRGLIAVHTDTGKPITTVHTLEPMAAVNLKSGEASHPRLRGDGESISWKGYIHIPEEGEYRFQVRLRGSSSLTLGGQQLFFATGGGAKPVVLQPKAVKLKRGVHSFAADFKRFPGLARLELFWQGPGFRLEPLPSRSLGHLPQKVPAALARDRLADAGRLLVEESACIRCHPPADEGRLSKTLGSRSGPDLTRVGERTFAGYLESWLERPSRWRPGTAMPEMFAADEKVERHAVARYLSSLGGPLIQETRKEDKEHRESVLRGRLLFRHSGCAACHPEPTGKAAVPGKSNLYSPMRMISLVGLGGKTTAKKLAEYLRNPLALNETSRMPHLLLSAREAGDLSAFLVGSRMPGVEATLSGEHAASSRLVAFKRIETRADEVKEFTKLSAREQWLELGKRLVLEKACNSCHTIEPDGKPFASVLPGIDLDEPAAPIRQDRGCLAEKPPRTSKSPRYPFTKEQRAAVIAFLSTGLKGAGSPAPGYTARLDIQRFNCLACHTRDGEGGLSKSLIDDLMRAATADHAELVTPPTLTHVGHKLRTSWLKKVLVEEGRARPWMSLRMPQFGAKNVSRLAEGLVALDGAEVEDTPHTVTLDREGMAAGRKLIAKDALACVSCHDLAGVANTGTRGPDLASMSRRVRYEWYRRWLEQPQREAPGTRMPTIFTHGRSPLDKILGGKPDAQAEAMWGYLSQGKKGR
jgi:mono/diheme cytochrome c family protein